MSAKYVCQIVAELLASHGVKYVVTSPGSRNSPLIKAVVEHDSLHPFSVVDERSAAFRALGMAQATGSPVALICTSGTALLNYAPAVAEAYYSHMPLIVVSADRPAQWIDQDDSQTIRQPGALDNFVKYSCNLPDFEDPEGEMSWYAARCCNDAMIAAMSSDRGPVHINVQIGEPLNKDYPALSHIPVIREIAPVPALTHGEIKVLSSGLTDKKVMVVDGFMPPSHVLSRGLSRLAAVDNVVVLTESPANVHAKGVYPCIDRLLLQIDKEADIFRPDVVITVGGALISRNLKHYLRNCRRLQHWSVGMNEIGADVFKHLSLRIKSEPARFISMLAGALGREKISSDYRSKWLDLHKADELRHDKKISDAGWSSLKAFSIIMPTIPAGTNLQLSNGTCIRYAQLFHNPAIHSCHCNRGVSGIDGCTSTASGAAMVYNGMTLLITGDMSFSYDLNGLSKPLSPGLKIIVINNRGGGIFRFVKATRDLPERERYLCAGEQTDPCRAATMFGIKAVRVCSAEELTDALKDFYKPSGPSLLEIYVPADDDAETLVNYFKNR